MGSDFWGVPFCGAKEVENNNSVNSSPPPSPPYWAPVRNPVSPWICPSGPVGEGLSPSSCRGRSWDGARQLHCASASPFRVWGSAGGIYKRRCEAEKVVTPLSGDPYSLALNPYNGLWRPKPTIQGIQVGARGLDGVETHPAGAERLPSFCAQQASLRSVSDPLPEHSSSFPRRKEDTVGDLASLRQLSDCFPQVRGKNSRRLNGGLGATRERSPLTPSVPAKRDIGYPGESERKGALIAEPGDKHDYQLRALSQKVS